MSWKEDPRWAYVFVNLSCLMWASNFVLGRTLRDEIGPLTITASRFAVASLFYVVILGRSAAKERLLPRDWALLTAMALTGVLGFPVLLSGSSTHDGNRCRTDQRHRSAHDGGPGCGPAKGAIVPSSCAWWAHIVFRRDTDRQRAHSKGSSSGMSMSVIYTSSLLLCSGGFTR